MRLVISLSILLIIFFVAGVNSASAYNKEIMEFDNIYEASGAVTLADGRILIIEDNKNPTLKLITIQDDGSFTNTKLLGIDLTPVISDLEGLAADNLGNIYAITSHSLTPKSGKRKDSREQLIRFRIEGNKIIQKVSYTKLRYYLEQLVVADKTLRHPSRKINIEAISFDQKKEKLLIGFRSPLIKNKALIITLENPAAIFDKDEKPLFSKQNILLNLRGGSIRSLNYDVSLGGYLLTNEIKKKSGKKRSKLWFWSGNINDKPRKVSVPGFKKLKNAEGITTVVVAGQPGILIVGDNGNIRKSNPAKYLLRSYEQISIRGRN